MHWGRPNASPPSHPRRALLPHLDRPHDRLVRHVFEDEIGVSPSLSPKTPNISVPYGALVPEALDGILGAGRHIACDPNSHTFLREIPQCWFTGQAAGVAAALAAASGTPPRHVAVRVIQRELLQQGAYLSPAVATALAQVSAAAE